ncbi:hypothetical protein [Priestia megaterium]|uniref:hypothetical protein n=1 Tax=Priestia megaterium TaxID=1404 RepID=UPI0039F724D4
MAVKVFLLLNDDLIPYPSKGSDPTSPFNKAINAITQMPGDELYITTGYHSKKTFDHLGGKNFANNLNSGFTKTSGGTIHLLAGKFSDAHGKVNTDCVNFKCTCKDCYPKKYKYFCDDLKKNVTIPYPSISINARLHTQWHSKITFKLKGSKFVGMVLGSSNLSYPALYRYLSSNTECDLLIYDDSYDSIVQSELSSFINNTVIDLGTNTTIALRKFKNANGSKDITNKINLFEYDSSELSYLTKEQIQGLDNDAIANLIELVEKKISSVIAFIDKTAQPLEYT